MDEFLRRVDEYYEVNHVILPRRLFLIPRLRLPVLMAIFIVHFDSGDTVYCGDERVRGSNFRYNGCE